MIWVKMLGVWSLGVFGVFEFLGVVFDDFGMILAPLVRVIIT